MIDFEDAALVNHDFFFVFLQVLIQIVFTVLNEELVAFLLLKATDLVEKTSLGEVHGLLDFLVAEAFVLFPDDGGFRLFVWWVIGLFRSFVFLFLFLCWLLPTLFRASIGGLPISVGLSFRLFEVNLLWLQVRVVENSDLTLLDVDLFTQVTVSVFLLAV